MKTRSLHDFPIGSRVEVVDRQGDGFYLVGDKGVIVAHNGDEALGGIVQLHTDDGRDYAIHIFWLEPIKSPYLQIVGLAVRAA